MHRFEVRQIIDLGKGLRTGSGRYSQPHRSLTPPLTPRGFTLGDRLDAEAPRLLLAVRTWYLRPA